MFSKDTILAHGRINVAVNFVMLNPIQCFGGGEPLLGVVCYPFCILHSAQAPLFLWGWWSPVWSGISLRWQPFWCKCMLLWWQRISVKLNPHVAIRRRWYGIELHKRRFVPQVQGLP